MERVWQPLALCLTLFLLPPAWAAPTPAIKKAPVAAIKEAPPPANNSAQEYQAAKNFLFRLDLDQQQKKNRSNWVQCADNFSRLYQAHQKDDLIGPSSLYMMTRVYRLMYSHFHQAGDLDSAIHYSRKLAQDYPGNSLVDDALYAAAGLIPQERDQNNRQAAALYRQIIQQCPDSDHYERAKAQLALLDRGEPPPTSITAPVKQQQATPPTSPAPAAVASPAGGKQGVSAPPAPATVAKPAPIKPTPSPPGPAQLAPAKFWSSEGYTRIVVQASGSIDFTATLDTKTATSPTLVLDFQNATIATAYRTATPRQDGLVQEKRTTQTGKQAVRMEFVLNNPADYTVFHLNDPFRVIVDLRAIETRGQSHSTLAGSGRAGVAKALARPSSASTPATTAPNAAAPLPQPRSDMANTTSPRQASSKDSLSLAQQLGLGVQKIVLDPGHGGKDPGAMAHGVKEKDVVLAIAKKLAIILEQKYKFEVLLTRSSDIFLPLEERTAIANANKSDLFISIHTNAHRNTASRGIETYFLNLATDAEAMRVAALENATSTHHIGEMEEILASLMKNANLEESSRLARFVQTHLCSGPGQGQYRNLGVKQAPFYVLIGAEMPAILIELLFITNPDEAKKLNDPLFQNLLAEQIAKGIVAYIEHQRTAALHF